MCPPTWASKSVSAIGEPRRLCSFGLKSPNCSVNTAKARSSGASTVTCRRTTTSSVGLIGLLRLFGDVSKAAQCAVPEGVELVSQREDTRLVEAVDPSGAGRLLIDEAGVLEHLQVLG